MYFPLNINVFTILQQRTIPGENIFAGTSKLITQYQKSHFSNDYWNYLRPEPKIVQLPALPVEEDEALEPDFGEDEPPVSDSSEEEHPVFRRAGTKDSGFNPVSDDSRSQQSARTTTPPSVSPPRQGTSNQEFNSPESEQEFSTPPQTIVKPSVPNLSDRRGRSL